jgi:hypothetical protein
LVSQKRTETKPPQLKQIHPLKKLVMKELTMLLMPMVMIQKQQMTKNPLQMLMMLQMLQVRN